MSDDRKSAAGMSLILAPPSSPVHVVADAAPTQAWLHEFLCSTSAGAVIMPGMMLAEIYLTAGLVILALMTFLWPVSLKTRNAGIVDVFWGTGFVITAWIYFGHTPEGSPARKWLLALLVTIWGLRLSAHIFRRNAGKAEDFRYRKWREEAGRQWWWRSYFTVFLLQGLLMWIISVPLLAAQQAAEPTHLTWLDYAAAAVWMVGFLFEAVGDWQLLRFKKNPANKGKVLQAGLWRYTRHPNYFGDAVQWWGYYGFALSAGAWWTIFSPLLMTFLLRRVSGV
ncbi:MAG: DUF1295 domain-containing protein, partial [Acidobacteria bacterium]|nr:DUF1295 domain-containing protein [Acidobacteriota bacterium]